jgi:Nucleotidyl transferase AbiEii toxin, Type IV TA system
MKKKTSGLALSVKTKLVAHARQTGVDPNLILNRFATERYLYRLSQSRHAERFVLKGALLMLVWLGETIRPTRDADLLGFGDLSPTALKQVFLEICLVNVQPDGIQFLPNSIEIDAIRKDDEYGGQRVNLQGLLGEARLAIQVDVGIGDVVTPDPQWLEYPTLLDFPRPRLRAYWPETTIAEKLHAMVLFGATNSRMRDFFDIYMLADREAFVMSRLARAVQATFERRRTPLPEVLPLALTNEFAKVEGKQAQWSGFRRRNRLESVPEDLAAVIERLSAFLGPILITSRGNDAIDRVWSAGGLWH